jgi:hypothetical protein
MQYANARRMRRERRTHGMAKKDFFFLSRGKKKVLEFFFIET